MRIDVMGIPFDNVTMEEAITAAGRMLGSGRASVVVTPNSEIVYEAMDSSALWEAISRADLILPDGAGVVLASKILGTPLKQKVAGIDFASALFASEPSRDLNYYFLGGKPGIAEKAAARLKEQYPSLKICGTRDGYFKPEEEQNVVEAVNASGADVLFVCLGAPKQEFFMQKYRDQLHVSMMLGLGGSLDAFAGEVKRAPKWMIRCNLEWLYRLIKEPRRFGRMLRLPKFIFRVLWRRIRG